MPRQTAYSVCCCSYPSLTRQHSRCITHTQPHPVCVFPSHLVFLPPTPPYFTLLCYWELNLRPCKGQTSTIPLTELQPYLSLRLRTALLSCSCWPCSHSVTQVGLEHGLLLFSVPPCLGTLYASEVLSPEWFTGLEAFLECKLSKNHLQSLSSRWHTQILGNILWVTDIYT